MGSVQEGYTLVQYDQQVREILGRTAVVYCYNVKPGFYIVVSVVSVERKKFIGQIEVILSCTTGVSVISFALSICTGGFHKDVSVL